MLWFGMRRLRKRSLYCRSAALPLPLTSPYIRCMSSLLLLVKSPIKTEISSVNVDFGSAADHWLTPLLPSTIANIVIQLCRKGRQVCMTVGGRNF
ncbi:hypothetical protein TNCV_4879681 [Trichonephila clavipes]|nr:hypothetical protein TNCV_4879681 [Trichonephila clavipes]